MNTMANYEKGKYLCEVIGQGFGELPSDKKTPFFFLEVKPLGIINPANPKEMYSCDDFPRTANLFLTEDSVSYTIDRLRTLGWNGTSFKEIEPNGSHSFKGLKIELICTHDTKANGKTYDRFNFPNLGGGKLTESDPSVASKMDNLYSKALKSTLPVATPQTAPVEQTPAEQPPPQAAAAAPVAAAVGDGTEDSDSIPF